MAHQKELFEGVIQKLVALGEDKEEMVFWREVFDDLEEREQNELLSILESELERLERLQKN